MKKELTKHHVIPSSRGGKDTPQNIAMVNGKQHELYHQLFGNMTPDEILVWLKTYFWKGG